MFPRSIYFIIYFIQFRKIIWYNSESLYPRHKCPGLTLLNDKINQTISTTVEAKRISPQDLGFKEYIKDFYTLEGSTIKEGVFHNKNGTEMPSSFTVGAGENLPEWFGSTDFYILSDILGKDMLAKHEKIVNERWKNTYLQYLGLLDACTLQQSNQNIAEYNWRIAGGNQKKALYREQIALTLPVLKQAFVQARIPGLQKSVDAAKPIFKELEHSLKIPSSAAKTMGSIKGNRIQSKIEEVFLDKKYDLVSIEEKGWPARGRAVPIEQQWNYFLDLVLLDKRWFSQNPVENTYKLNVWSNPSRRFHQSSIPLLAKEKEIFNLEDGGTDIYDMIKSFTRQCLFPTILDLAEEQGIKDSSLNLFFKLGMAVNGESALEQALTLNRSVWELHQLSKEWHNRGLSRNSYAPVGISKWLPLVGVQEWQDITLVPLCSAASLWEEGQAMHHCVSSYSHDCSNYHCAIFSIQKGGKRLSTLELKLDLPNQRVKIAQNRGINNSEPHMDTHGATAWLREQINGKGIATAWQSIEHSKENRKEIQQDHLNNFIQYDRSDQKARDEHLEQWSFVLKDWQGEAHQEWVEKTGLKQTMLKVLKLRVKVDKCNHWRN